MNNRIDKFISRIENELEVKIGFGKNEANQNISYKDIAFMAENQKQFMEFFKSLDASTKYDITEENILFEIEDAYQRYKENSSNAYYKVMSIENISDEEKKEYMKKMFVENLSVLGNIMKKSSCLEFLTRKHNKKYLKISQSLEANIGDIEKEFDPNFLSRKTLAELETLTAFWTNKFIKFIDNMEEYYMYIKDTEKRQSMTLPEEDKMLFVSLQKKRIIEKIYLESDTEDELNNNMRNFKKRYKDIFKNLQCDRTNLVEDFYALATFEKMKYSLYDAKDTAIRNLIVNRMNEVYRGNPLQTIKNWGIKQDEKGKKEYIITIELPYYLLPISLHFPKTCITEILSSANMKDVDLPEYDIDSDFKDENGKMYGVNVVFMPNLNQQEAIKKELKKYKKQKDSKNVNRAKILSHIYCQLSGKSQMVTNTQRFIKVHDDEGEPTL